MFTRNFTLILLGNIILGAAMPMLIILGSLTGSMLTPQDWLATAPPTAQMLAGIAVAAPISLFMGRFGRQAGFLLGAIALSLGGLLAVLAIQTHSFALLCLAHMVFGASLVSVNYFRFAAAEAVSEAHRPQAISFTMASGLVAALLGPELFNLFKDGLAPLPFAGAYATIAVLGVLGALPVLGLSLSHKQNSNAVVAKVHLSELLQKNPVIILAMAIAALSQAMMVLLMVPTPLAMIGCGFNDTQASDVIRWHVVAMFAPGFFTGTLIKRYGAKRIAAIGLALLSFSAIAAWLGLTLMNFYVALILLGVGWNFGFVSGTHMLQATLSDEERPRIQGLNDTIIAIASASASLLSGALYAGIGWVGLCVVSLPIMMLGSLVIFRRHRAARLDRWLQNGSG